MGAVRRISAALKVESDVDEFVGEVGTLFYSIDTGSLRLSDGKTVGGHPLLPGLDAKPQGTLSLVSIIDKDDTIVGTCTDVRRISFDKASGFSIEEEDFNSVKVTHKSDGFQVINVDGKVAVRSTAKNPQLNLTAGKGIKIRTHPSDPQGLEIENLAPSASFGAIVDVSVDENGDLLFTHADMFDSDIATINDDGYFILSTE